MDNLLLQNVEYKYDETPLGTWRSFMYPSGLLFREFQSRQRVMGFPLIHYTRGKCPETGRRIVAWGVIAVGRLAVGGIAIGQASVGLIAVGQAGIGLLLGLGQLSTGAVAVGQAAIGLLFGLGQLTTGIVAIGQITFGRFGIGQVMLGKILGL